MSYEMFEAKKNFVTGVLQRCMCFAHPEISYLKYQIDEEGMDETVTILFVDGFVRRVSVTGDSLHAIITDVNHALE